MNTPNEPARLSTSLNAAASEAEQRAADAIADGNPESAEVTLRVAEQMRRLATNHQAEAILSGDATDDPAQVEPDTCETCNGTGGADGHDCPACQPATRTVAEHAEDVAAHLRRTFPHAAPEITEARDTFASLRNGTAGMIIASDANETTITLVYGGQIEPAALRLVLGAVCLPLGQGTAPDA